MTNPARTCAALIVLLVLGAAGAACLSPFPQAGPGPAAAASRDSPAPALSDTGSGRVFLNETGTKNQYAAGELIVRFDPARFRTPAEMQAYMDALHARTGAQVIREFNAAALPGLQLVRLPPSLPVPDAAVLYTRDPGVLYAEPEYRILPAAGSAGLQEAKGSAPQQDRMPVIPDDPEFSRQYYLQNTGQDVLNTSGTGGADINATAAWTNSRGSAAVIAGILDTGIDTADPDLAGNIRAGPGTGGAGRNFAGGARDDRVEDRQGHGTAVARILGAVTNNSRGTAGVAWEVRLVALRVFGTGSGDTTTTADLIDAIQYADENNVTVITIAWTTTAGSRALEDAIRASPALFVAAAGNSGSDNDLAPRYPASYRLPNLVAVAATDNTDRLAPFSNYGRESVDLAAPGTGIPVYACADPGAADPRCGYYLMDGTSAAVPQVAGVAVLVKSANPRLTAPELREILRTSAKPLPSLAGKTASGGRLDAYAAVWAAGQAGKPGTAGLPVTPCLPGSCRTSGTATGQLQGLCR